MRRTIVRSGPARVAAVLSALLVCLAGCKPQRQPVGPDPALPEPTPQPTQVDPDLVSANTSFGFKLFHELVGEEPSENVFISPSSIAFALAMTCNGADGETKNAMAEVLGLGGMSLDEANQANADLMTSLQQAEPAVELSIANSLWAREEVEFLPDFLGTNEEFYGAKVTALDFTDPEASKTINGWVSDETRGQIGKLVPDVIDADTILFLINAIYFRGKWAEQFDEADTRDDTFTLLDGTQKAVPMMSQSGEFRYSEGDGFQAISLPYADERIAMYIFLPAEKGSLAEFCGQLQAEAWEAWVSQLHKQEGSITMPRLKAEYEAELNDALKALGMEVAFTAGADFGNMVEQWVSISKVIHKSFVEVNEEGTEAAAATSVEISKEGPSQRPFRMAVDQPFFCAIRDNETGTLLFMGAIVDPGQA